MAWQTFRENTSSWLGNLVIPHNNDLEFSSRVADLSYILSTSLAFILRKQTLHAQIAKLGASVYTFFYIRLVYILVLCYCIILDCKVTLLKDYSANQANVWRQILDYNFTLFRDTSANWKMCWGRFSLTIDPIKRHFRKPWQVCQVKSWMTKLRNFSKPRQKFGGRFLITVLPYWETFQQIDKMCRGRFSMTKWSCRETLQQTKTGGGRSAIRVTVPYWETFRKLTNLYRHILDHKVTLLGDMSANLDKYVEADCRLQSYPIERHFRKLANEWK